MKTKIKNLFQRTTVITVSAFTAFVLFMGISITYATWEAPTGEVEGGKFMNLLGNIMDENPTWDESGNLVSKQAVKKARTLTDADDNTVVYSENGNVIIQLGQ